MKNSLYTDGFGNHIADSIRLVALFSPAGLPLNAINFIRKHLLCFFDCTMNMRFKQPTFRRESKRLFLKEYSGFMQKQDFYLTDTEYVDIIGAIAIKLERY